MDARLEQPENAPEPILMTLGGMVIEARLLHEENAELPIAVTLGGMVIKVRLLHEEYLEVIDYQLFAFNTVEKWIGSYLWVYGK